MSELTKMPTTKNFAEISIRIPVDKKLKVKALIEDILELAEVGYMIKERSAQYDQSTALEEVFPDLHPGSAIKGLRYREGMTQKQLAEKIGVKRHHISEMENGKRSIGKEMAKRLAHALKSDFKVFL